MPDAGFFSLKILVSRLSCDLIDQSFIDPYNQIDKRPKDVRESKQKESDDDRDDKTAQNIHRVMMANPNS